MPDFTSQKVALKRHRFLVCYKAPNLTILESLTLLMIRFHMVEKFIWAIICMRRDSSSKSCLFDLSTPNVLLCIFIKLKILITQLFCFNFLTSRITRMLMTYITIQCIYRHNMLHLDKI